MVGVIVDLERARPRLLGMGFGLLGTRRVFFLLYLIQVADLFGSCRHYFGIRDCSLRPRSL